MNCDISNTKGWTSFDDSPVHAQAAGANLAVGPSPWGDDGWAKFQTEKDNSKSKSTKTQSISEHKNNQHNENPSSVQKNDIQSSRYSKSASFVKPSSVLKSDTSSPSVTASSAILHSGSNHLVSSEKLHQPITKEHQESQKINSDYQDPWCITPEQRQYYTKQFSSMQPDFEGKINGETARNFFTKSKLPILELSHVWELSDMDQDGHLTLDEFCTAFHLVVARKNGYELPSQLPQALVPSLIDVTATSKLKSSEQWETFSDRTSSSTTLANFDHVLDPTQDTIHQPVPLRITPSQQHQQWMGVADSERSETLDEDSTTSSPLNQTKKQKSSTTNPYGYLKNELSEPDSSCDEKGSSSNPPSLSGHDEKADDKLLQNSITHKGRTLSDSSLSSSATSSVATSDRSIEDDLLDHGKNKTTEHENGDWSSHLLRPRSTSSDECVSIPPLSSVPAPTPPPRPQAAHPSTVVSPMPKPRLLTKKEAIDRVKPLETSKILENYDSRAQKPAEVLESFADFSSFNAQSAVPTSRDDNLDEDPEENKHVDNSLPKKAPVKPPRSRILSSEKIKPENSSVATTSQDVNALSPPKQDVSRKKSAVQASIRELKARNTQLSRMNSELQQQLKRVMETRIGVEMNIHQMRPFSQ